MEELALDGVGHYSDNDGNGAVEIAERPAVPDRKDLEQGTVLRGTRPLGQFSGPPTTEA